MAAEAGDRVMLQVSAPVLRNQVPAMRLRVALVAEWSAAAVVPDTTTMTTTMTTIQDGKLTLNLTLIVGSL